VICPGLTHSTISFQYKLFQLRKINEASKILPVEGSTVNSSPEPFSYSDSGLDCSIHPLSIPLLLFLLIAFFWNTNISLFSLDPLLYPQTNI